MNLGSEGIAQALRRLNAKLVYAEMPPVNLVVCGGAALVSLGLIRRSTSDVDVIGSLPFNAMDSTSDSVRHLSDLLDLEPSEDEAGAAVDWLLRRDSSDVFKQKLKQVLDRIGHERIGEKI